jgi:hypothetical protein
MSESIADSTKPAAEIEIVLFPTALGHLPNPAHCGDRQGAYVERAALS